MSDVQILLNCIQSVKKICFDLHVSFGCPIRDFSGNVIAALGIGMPAFQVKKKQRALVIGEMQHAARSISKDLGFSV